MNQKVKAYLENEYKALVKYVKENPVRCIRAGIESIIMSSLMVSWIFYVMKPFLEDGNKYGISGTHFDPIAVLGIDGFVMLSFVFLLTFGWFYISKGLRMASKKYEQNEPVYQNAQRSSD